MILKKGILVLPSYNNNADGGDNTNFSSYYPIRWKNNRLQVWYEGKFYNVLGLFHTHPVGEGFDYMNEWDINIVAKGAFGATPLFYMGENWVDGIYRTGPYDVYSFFNTTKNPKDEFVNGRKSFTSKCLEYWNGNIQKYY